MSHFRCTLLLLAAAGARAQTVPIDGIAHAGFRVSSLERSRAYYTGQLGFQQAFDLKNDAGDTFMAFFKVNDEQYVELSPGLPAGEPVRFTHLAFQTPDIETLRRGLSARGLSPSLTQRGRDGNVNCSLRDPENQRIEFVQYLDGSLHTNARGKFMDTRRISDRLQHVGVVIPREHVDAAMHFYHDQLGLTEVWRYAPGGELRLIKLATPGKRPDIVELMIHSKPPNTAEYGSMYHINFEVPEITAPFRQLLDRGTPLTPGLRPVVNAENIWAINVYDPDGTRTEIQDLRKVPVMRLGLVGLVHGHVAGFLNHFPGRYDAAIVGVAEPDAALGKKYAEHYKLDPAIFYKRVEDMLDKTKPQAVVVFTDTFDHLRIVEACAARGIHVMMEKPLSVSVDQARAMQAAAHKGHVHVMVNYETTWHRSNHAAFAFAREKGALGDIRKMVAHDGHRGPKEIGVQPEFLAWLSDPARNGAGALFDFGCYGADLMTWLMNGERPLSVTAVTQHLKPEVYPNVDDEADLILTYAHATGIIQASWNWTFDRKDLEIYGTTGTVRTVGMDRIRQRAPAKDEVELEAPPLNPRYDDPLSYLTAIVRGEAEPSGLSSLDTNLVVMEILEAARKSAATGQTVHLNGSH